MKYEGLAARHLQHVRTRGQGEFYFRTTVDAFAGDVRAICAEERNPYYISETVRLADHSRVRTTLAIRQCEQAIEALKEMIEKLKTRRDNLCLED